MYKKYTKAHSKKIYLKARDTKINDVMNAKNGRKEFIYLSSTQKV